MARQLITSNNYSPLVLIINWFLCIVSVLSMVARGATKATFNRSLRSDDYTSLSSLILNIAQSVAVTIRTSNGLGKRLTALGPSQIAAYLKATYADNMLYISALCLSEISVLLLVRDITPDRRDRQTILIVGIVIVAWAVIGFIVSAAECSPRPWDFFSGHCIDRFAWINFLEAMNMVINTTLVVLPILILSKVHISRFKKFSIVSLFALRITVVIASICKLVYWNQVRHSDDQIFTIWRVTICTQTIECLSICSFCILFLKPLFEALDTGFIRTDELRRKGQMNTKHSYNLSTMSSGKVGKPITSNIEQLASEGHNDTTVTALGNEAGWDGGSQSSQAQIIRETRTWAVESEATGDKA